VLVRIFALDIVYKDASCKLFFIPCIF